jgi:hypothetical protein
MTLRNGALCWPGSASAIDFVAQGLKHSEARLEIITLALNGDGAPRVTVTRLDNSKARPAEMVTTIPNVRRISLQLDVDGSEDGLEIEDINGVLSLLRLESKVDGAS